MLQGSTHLQIRLADGFGHGHARVKRQAQWKHIGDHARNVSRCRIPGADGQVEDQILRAGHAMQKNGRRCGDNSRRTRIHTLGNRVETVDG